MAGKKQKKICREDIERMETEEKIKYEIAEELGLLDKVLEEFDNVIGLSNLKAIHLNDSMNGLGSHKDRHAKIGEGQIGLEALVRVICHPALQGLPFILETPNDDAGWTKEIALLRERYNAICE